MTQRDTNRSASRSSQDHQGLLKRRIETQTALQAHHHPGHHRQAQGVLAQDGANTDIQQQTHGPAPEDANPLGRGQDPVQQGQGDPGWPQFAGPFGQRQENQQQGHPQARDEEPAAGGELDHGASPWDSGGGRRPAGLLLGLLASASLWQGPDQQHLMATIEVGIGGGRHPREGLARFTLDLAHPRHGITGRKATAEAGGDQEVTFLHIGVVGDVGQIELVDQTGTRGHGAQAVTIDPHRQAMSGVGDE